ncbi:hypothetical protein POMI540_2937 [Schizosaccharomyces pombe]
MRETNESPKSQNPSEEATTVNELSCEAKPKLLFTPTKSSLSIGNFPYKEFDPVLKFPGIHYTYSRERLWGTCVILSTLFWSYYVLSNSELLEFEASEYSLLFILIIALDALLTVSLFGLFHHLMFLTTNYSYTINSTLDISKGFFINVLSTMVQALVTVTIAFTKFVTIDFPIYVFSSLFLYHPLSRSRQLPTKMQLDGSGERKTDSSLVHQNPPN